MRDNRTLNPCVFVFLKRDSISSSYESDKRQIIGSNSKKKKEKRERVEEDREEEEGFEFFLPSNFLLS